MDLNFITTQARPFVPTLDFKEIDTITTGVDEVATTGAYTCVIGDESEFGRRVKCEWYIDRVKLIDAWFDTVEEAERQAVTLLHMALTAMLEQVTHVNRSTEAILIKA